MAGGLGPCFPHPPAALGKPRQAQRQERKGRPVKCHELSLGGPGTTAIPRRGLTLSHLGLGHPLADHPAGVVHHGGGLELHRLHHIADADLQREGDHGGGWAVPTPASPAGGDRRVTSGCWPLRCARSFLWQHLCSPKPRTQLLPARKGCAPRRRAHERVPFSGSLLTSGVSSQGCDPRLLVPRSQSQFCSPEGVTAAGTRQICCQRGGSTQAGAREISQESTTEGVIIKPAVTQKPQRGKPRFDPELAGPCSSYRGPPRRQQTVLSQQPEHRRTRRDGKARSCPGRRDKGTRHRTHPLKRITRGKHHSRQVSAQRSGSAAAAAAQTQGRGSPRTG